LVIVDFGTQSGTEVIYSHISMIFGICKQSNKWGYKLIFVCCLMVFNATYNTSSAISWRSALSVEESGGPGENHRPVASH
jgi:hypothetical protein